jgi:hypothetical protein
MRNDQRREQADVLEGDGDVLALGDQLPGALEAVADDGVADHVLGGADRVDDGDPGGVHHGEHAGEARQDDLAQDRTEHRQLQLEFVEAVAEGRIGLDRQLDADDDQRRHDEEQVPELLDEGRGGDEDLGLGGQGLAHVLDEAGHLRHQIDHQEEGDAEHHRADEGRVHEQLLGVGRQLVLPLQRFAQAPQHLGQVAGVLAGQDQAAEDLVEDFRVLAHRLREGAAASIDSIMLAIVSRKRGWNRLSRRSVRPRGSAPRRG